MPLKTCHIGLEPGFRVIGNGKNAVFNSFREVPPERASPNRSPRLKNFGQLTSTAFLRSDGSPISARRLRFQCEISGFGLQGSHRGRLCISMHGQMHKTICITVRPAVNQHIVPLSQLRTVARWLGQGPDRPKCRHCEAAISAGHLNRRVDRQGMRRHR